MSSQAQTRMSTYRQRFATFYNTRIRNITSKDSPDGVWCVTAIVCENERYRDDLAGSTDPDGYNSTSKWSCDFLTRADWPALSDVSGTCSLHTLRSVELLAGYQWVDDWSVDIRPNRTDADGYYYASCFEDLCGMLWDEDDLRIAQVEIMESRDKPKSVRSKCWHRHMVPNTQLPRTLRVVPYVLRVDVREICGDILNGRGSVRVSVFVNGAEVHSRMHTVGGPSRDNGVIEQWATVEVHSDAQYNRAHFELMEFSVPLTRVPVDSIKFVVCKFMPEDASPKVIGIAQDDGLLKRKLWPVSNKICSLRLPVRCPLSDGNMPSLASLTVDPHAPPSGILRVVMQVEEYTVFPLHSTRLVTIPDVPAVLGSEPQGDSDNDAENFAASYVKAEVLHRKVKEELAGMIRYECESYLSSTQTVLPDNVSDWIASRLGSVEHMHTSHLKRSDIRSTIESICMLGRLSCGHSLQDEVEAKQPEAHASPDRGTTRRGNFHSFIKAGESIESKSLVLRPHLFPFFSDIAHPGILYFRGEVSEGDISAPPHNQSRASPMPLFKQILASGCPSALVNVQLDPPEVDRNGATNASNKLDGEAASNMSSAALSQMGSTSERQNSIQRQYYVNMHTAIGDIHYFKWSSQYDYLSFLKQMSQAQKGMDVSCTQTLLAHYPPHKHTARAMSPRPDNTLPMPHARHLLSTYPTTLQISAANGTVRWCVDAERADMTTADKQSRQCDYCVYLCDVTYISTENMFDFSKQYLLEVEVSDIILSSNQLAGESVNNVIVSLSSPDGDENYCSYHRPLNSYDEVCRGNKSVLHLFVSAQNIMQNTPLRLSIHTYDTDSSFVFGNGQCYDLRCIGESILSLPQLVLEAYSVPPVIHSLDLDDKDKELCEDSSPLDDVSSQRSMGFGVINRADPLPKVLKRYMNTIHEICPSLTEREVHFEHDDKKRGYSITLDVPTVSRVLVGPPGGGMRIIFQSLRFSDMETAGRSDKDDRMMYYYYQTRLVDSHGVVVSDTKLKTDTMPYKSQRPVEVLWTAEHNFHCATYVHIQVWLRTTVASCEGETYLSIAEARSLSVDGTPKTLTLLNCRSALSSGVTGHVQVLIQCLPPTLDIPLHRKSLAELLPQFKPHSFDTTAATNTLDADMIPLLQKYETVDSRSALVGRKDGSDSHTVPAEDHSVILSSRLTLVTGSTCSWPCRPINSSDEPVGMCDVYYMSTCATGLLLRPYQHSTDTSCWEDILPIAVTSIHNPKDVCASAHNQSVASLLPSYKAHHTDPMEASEVQDWTNKTFHSATRQLITSTEYSPLANCAMIPWGHVLEVTIIAQASLIVTIEVHSQADHSVNVVELLVGPCPAYSLHLLLDDLATTCSINQRVDMFARATSPLTTIDTESIEKVLDIACLLLLDVASLAKDCKLTLGSDIIPPLPDLMNSSSRPSTLSMTEHRSTMTEQTMLVSARHRINLSKFHSMLRNVQNQFNCSAAIAQYFRITVYVGFILFRSSQVLEPRSHSNIYDNYSIVKKVTDSFEEYDHSIRKHKATYEHNCDSLFRKDEKAVERPGASCEMSALKECMRRQFSLDKRTLSDVGDVQYLLNEGLRGCFRLIMNSWEAHQPGPFAPHSMLDVVIISSHTIPPMASAISVIVNACYSHVGSILDRILNSPSLDDGISTNVDILQQRLDLVHFLLCQEQIPGVLLNDLLIAIGAQFSRPVSVAQILNEEFLLEKFHDTLHDIIAWEMNQAFAAESDTGSQVSIDSVVFVDGGDINLPWEPHEIAVDIVIGPYPECVFQILSSYTHLWAVPHVIVSAEMLAHITHMNDIINMELLTAYSILARQYHSIIKSTNDILEHITDSSKTLTPLGEATSHRKQSAMFAQIMRFLCSICNDISRVLSTHLPTVVSNCPNITVEMEKRVHSVCLDLSVVSWTAAELIAKAIFSSMGAIFLRDLDDIHQRYPSAVEVMLTLLDDSLVRMRKSLLPFGYEQLLLSCEHRVILRYFLVLYDAALSPGPHSEHNFNAVRDAKGMTNGDDEARYSTATSHFSTRSSTRETMLSSPLGRMHASIHTDGELIIETMQKHTLDNFLNKLCVKQMFGQLLIFVSALSADYSDGEDSSFAVSVRELQSTGVEDRAITVLATLKGYGLWEKIFKLWDVRLHTKARSRSTSCPSDPTCSWNSLALRTAFATSHRESAPHVSIATLMGLRGGLRGGFCDAGIVSEFYACRSSGGSHARRRLKVSELTLRHLRLPEEMEADISCIYVRLLCGHHSAESCRVPYRDDADLSWPAVLELPHEMAPSALGGVLTIEVMCCQSREEGETTRMVAHLKLILTPATVTSSLQCDLHAKPYSSHPSQASCTWQEALPQTFRHACGATSQPKNDSGMENERCTIHVNIKWLA